MAERKQRLLRRPKMATVVADAVARDIIAKGLRPGDALPTEAAMIEEFAVARSTLREALLLLESEGLIVNRRGRSGGPVVQRPTAEHLARLLSILLSVSRTSFGEVVRARRVIEPELTAGAAANATDEQIEELADSVRGLEEAIDDEVAFLELNRRFHDLIATAAGNEVLAAFRFAIQHISDGHQVGIRFHKEARLAAVHAHAEIVEALRRHDPARATAVMVAHLDGFSDLIENRYPEVLDDQVKVVQPPQ